MPQINLSLTGATVVLVMGGKTFELTAPSLHIDTGTTPSTPGTPRIPASIKFEYEKDYEDAVIFPTIAEVMAATDELLGHLQSTGATTITAQWDEIKGKIDQVPVLGSARDTIENTEARLTKLGLELSRRTTDAGTDRYYMRFSIGLTFTPTVNPPSLLGITLTRFGAVVTASAEGTAAELGIS